MQRLQKIQKRNKNHSNVDNSLKKEDYIKEKRKSKNRKYDYEFKFNNNYNGYNDLIVPCNCKFAYKHNYHDKDCKFYNYEISNLNVVERYKEVKRNVLYNFDLLLLIIKELNILDIVNLLRSNTIFYNMIKDNISHIINNLQYEDYLNKQFIILTKYYCNLHNDPMNYNHFNNTVNTIISREKINIHMLEVFTNARSDTDLLNKKCSYYRCPKQDCILCKEHNRLFNYCYSHFIEELLEFDTKETYNVYKGTFKIIDYIKKNKKKSYYESTLCNFGFSFSYDRDHFINSDSESDLFSVYTYSDIEDNYN